MGLIGGSGVEDSVSSSVEDVKERRGDVEVNIRSPEELINQIDRLEEIVEGLRERQNRLLERHAEDVQELEIDAAIDVSKVEEGGEGFEQVDLSSVEQRLEMLESAVNRLETGFELDAEKVRENVIGEALDVEDSKFREIDERLNNLENQVDEIDEKVGRDEFEGLEQKVEDMSELLLKLSQQK